MFVRVQLTYMNEQLCRTGDKPLHEPMMTSQAMHDICITRPQWVKYDISKVIKNWYPQKHRSMQTSFGLHCVCWWSEGEVSADGLRGKDRARVGMAGSGLLPPGFNPPTLPIFFSPTPPPPPLSPIPPPPPKKKKKKNISFYEDVYIQTL